MAGGALTAGAALAAVLVFGGGDGPGSGVRPGTPPEVVALGSLAGAGEVTAANVGPEGAVIEATSGVSLAVPGGVFARETAVELERIEVDLESIDFAIERSLVVRVETNRDYPRLDAPAVLRIQAPRERTAVSIYEDGAWRPVQPGGEGDTLEIPLTHFSGNWVTAITAAAEWASERIPFGETGAERQQMEATHRAKIENQGDEWTKKFFGVGESTSRTHEAICAEFQTRLAANAGRYTWTVPPDFPGTRGMFDFLKHGEAPSKPPDNARWFWEKASASMEQIDGRLASLPAGKQVSPAEFLAIAIEANGGNVPLGVLAAHNFLKDTAYGGRLQADPAFTAEGAEANVAPAFGARAAKLETWRRSAPWSPVGRYDKLGPLYHIFAAMTATVFGSSTGGGATGFGTTAVAGEAFLRALGIGNDVPDREKGLADECGYDTGKWIVDPGLLAWFEPVEGKIEVGKPVPLTLTLRNVPEKGVSIELKVTSGEGTLSRSAVSVSKGGSGGACDMTGTTAVCGLTFTPAKLADAVVEARSGKTTTTVTIRGDPEISVTLNWSSRATRKFLDRPAGSPHPMAIEVWGSTRGTVETLVEKDAQGRSVLYGFGAASPGCQSDSATPATANFTTTRLRQIDQAYKGDDFYVWVNSMVLCSLFGDAAAQPLITWTAEIRVGEAPPVTCTGSYVSIVPSVEGADTRTRLVARINLTTDPAVACLGGN